MNGPAGFVVSHIGAMKLRQMEDTQDF